jgi:hypothetical protein
MVNGTNCQSVLSPEVNVVRCDERFGPQTMAALVRGGLEGGSGNEGVFGSEERRVNRGRRRRSCRSFETESGGEGPALQRAGRARRERAPSAWSRSPSCTTGSSPDDVVGDGI